MKSVEPLLKWPGGKRSLAKEIIPLMPVKYHRYFEPFLGGGAIYFALMPKYATLSDNNSDLINCYIQVRDNSQILLNRLKNLKNTETCYYKIRNTEPKGKVARAARLIYLTTLSFNGIYRTNLKGTFNVPYGYKKHLNPCDPEKINTISRTISSAELLCVDFEKAVERAKKNDLIYFDPPYTVSHSNNGFLKYNEKIFSWDDQIRLAGVARKLFIRGCHVVVSNAYDKEIINLYYDFKMKIIERSSVIAASSKYRREVKECIFYTPH